MAPKKTPPKAAKPKAAKPKAEPKAKPVAYVKPSVAPEKLSKTRAAASFGKTNKPTAPMRDRPLSPHLQVYSPQISSMLSILHRATGVALYIGAFLVAALLVTLTYGAENFAVAIELIQHPVGQVVVIGLTFCLFYHLLNGIRHLFWDAGKGFELHNMTLSGWLVFIFSILLTTAAWALAHPDCVLRCLERITQ